MFKKKELTSQNPQVQAESLNKENSSHEGIYVLGSGCAKCNNLENAVKEALSELGINESVGHITDFVEIAKFGVMSTPALVIDNQVVSYGKVLKKEEVIEILHKVRN